MTRQEAIAKVGRVIAGNRETIDGNEALLRGIIVDSAIALGLLDIGEPKCAAERAVAAMFKDCSYGGLITPRHAIRAIEAVGLQIVDKVAG